MNTKHLDLSMDIADIIASSNQLKYNILAATPIPTTGVPMTHEAIKKVMNLSDGTAELYRASFNNDVDMGNEYE